MNSTIMQKFLSCANKQTGSLDSFVVEQRAMSAAMRSREWIALEGAMERAKLLASEIARDEKDRVEAWHALLTDLDLPPDASSAMAIVAVPEDYRVFMGDTCRTLRTAIKRTRIENDALRAFAGSAASTLAGIMAELFPDRKGTIYGKSGAARPSGGTPVVLDTAF